MGWCRGGTGTEGGDEDEARRDSEMYGVTEEVVALHPAELLLFQLDLCGP